MAYQREKTNSTIFLEVNLLKHRLLTLYRSLENIIKDPETSGNDCAKCADVAAGIAISVIKLESEGIRFIKQLGLAAQTPVKINVATMKNLRDDDDGRGPDTNNWQYHQQTHQEQEQDDNRKF